MAEEVDKFLYARRHVKLDKETAAKLKFTALAAIKSLGVHNKYTILPPNEMGTTLLSARSYKAAKNRSPLLANTSLTQVHNKLINKLPPTHSLSLGAIAVEGVVALGPSTGRSIALEISSKEISAEQKSLQEGLTELGKTWVLGDSSLHITVCELHEEIDIEYKAHIPEAEEWMPQTIKLRPLQFGPRKFLLPENN